MLQLFRCGMCRESRRENSAVQQGIISKQQGQYVTIHFSRRQTRITAVAPPTPSRKRSVGTRRAGDATLALLSSEPTGKSKPRNGHRARPRENLRADSGPLILGDLFLPQLEKMPVVG